MYLHVGNNKNIRIKDIIGIFDADNATRSRETRGFLSNAEKRGEVSTAVEELPKSFILYRSGDKYEICFSQLSVSALEGRMKQ